jgi:glycosyltransferase involved in cell wall biosynthesis
MTVQPLVSVVMSVYNAQDYLNEAIESILNQSYENLEFIIINDGSTDSSLNIICSYMLNDSRISLIDRENKGLPFSLNEGVNTARGKYIARMDADDISLHTRIEEQVSFLESHNNIGICGSWVEVFGGRTGIIKHPISHDEMKIKMLFNVCFAHPTVMIRKNIFEKKNIKYNVTYSNSQDYMLWSEIQSITCMANIPKILLRYRISESSIGGLTDKNKSNARYNLLKPIYSKFLNELNVVNSQHENELHFILSEKTRIQEQKLNLKRVDEYLNKILRSNVIKGNKYRYLLSLISFKFVAVVLFQRQIGNPTLSKAIFYRLFYIGLFYIFVNKTISRMNEFKYYINRKFSKC